MTGVWDRPVERATRLLLGLVLFGLALATLVQADLGLDPWNVFTQGLARQIGLSLGQTTVIVSVLLLLLWIPLGERPGVGTIANALIVGPVVDAGLAIIPAPDQLAGQVAYMVAAIVGTAIATGLYVGAGWGPGPRDGLMTGLAARGVPIAFARAGHRDHGADRRLVPRGHRRRGHRGVRVDDRPAREGGAPPARGAAGGARAAIASSSAYVARWLWLIATGVVLL